MSDAELPADLRDELRATWHRYLDRVAPLRPALFGVCRRLTGNVWEAEDLVQDTLLRAFATLGSIHHEVRNPRAYLLRTATNLWIDTVRRREREATALAEPAAEAPAAAPAELRDAGERLFQRLSPQERAALVLKDAFDMSLDEIAEILRTTRGAVKAALHRGRGRLGAPEAAAAHRPRPSVALLDRFVALYRAADVPGLVALMLDGGSVENVGCGVEFGRENFPRETGWFHRAVFGHAEWPAELQYTDSRLERAELDGEPILLGFATRRGREALEQVLRIEEVDGRIARLRGYAFCPETMREVGERLGLPVRTGLYRYPTPAPGTFYTEPRKS
ncbi:MAG: RNA polymerase sigma factor [Myxococcota bacterium]